MYDNTINYQDNRIVIDAMRVFAMVLVVLYHCFTCYFSNWGAGSDDNIADIDWLSSWWECVIYIALSLFMFISGYLFGMYSGKYIDLGIGGFIRKKTERLLVPYVVWGCLYFIMFRPPLRRCLGGMGHLWFLLALFDLMVVAYIIYYLISRLRILGGGKKRDILLLFVALLWACLFIFRNDIPGIGLMQIISAVYYLPAFLGGVVSFKKSIIIVPKWLFVFLPLMISVSLLRYNQVSIFQIVPFYNIIIVSLSVLSCVTLFSLAKKCQRIIEKQSSLISFLSEQSMGVYIIHNFFISYCLCQPYFQDCANNHHFVFPISLFVVCLLLSLSISTLLRKTVVARFL